jgi:hypothetical protein
MEMNVEAAKVMKTSGRPSPVQIVIDQKQLENVEGVNDLGSMITNNARCTREIKSRIAVANCNTQHEDYSFRRQIGLKFKEESREVLLLEHGFVFC